MLRVIVSKPPLQLPLRTSRTLLHITFFTAFFDFRSLSSVRNFGRSECLSKLDTARATSWYLRRIIWLINRQNAAQSCHIEANVKLCSAAPGAGGLRGTPGCDDWPLGRTAVHYRGSTHEPTDHPAARPWGALASVG